MIRLLLVLATLVFFVLCALAMRWGWRNRVRRQSYLPAFPDAPEAEPADLLLPEQHGVYVGTTLAGDWQDRVAVGGVGLRATATVKLAREGLLFDREGASRVWIPAESLRDARTDRALAGKVMGIDGLLVVRWQVGDYEFDSGFRGDDKDVYGEWVTAVRSLAGQS
ncbi:MAG TPA: transporter [Pseudonocardiaceae bacterium]|jgi:hypothetical protein|nr:transporter [Pseudonocardiaceae bacterium]